MQQILMEGRIPVLPDADRGNHYSHSVIAYNLHSSLSMRRCEDTHRCCGNPSSGHTSRNNDREREAGYEGSDDLRQLHRLSVYVPFELLILDSH